MRHGNTQRRKRNRGSNQPRRGVPSRSHVYDSNGPDVRIRGTAYQVTEKYQALAKDALSSGNMVLAESYFQHAEHYQRIINSFEEESKVFGEGGNGRTSYDVQDEMGDDLSLPSSILGDSSDVQTQAQVAIA